MEGAKTWFLPGLGPAGVTNTCFIPGPTDRPAGVTNTCFIPGPTNRPAGVLRPRGLLLKHGTEQRRNIPLTKRRNPLCISVLKDRDVWKGLYSSEIIELVEKPLEPGKTLTVPPCKPKGGQIFLHRRKGKY